MNSSWLRGRPHHRHADSFDASASNGPGVSRREFLGSSTLGFVAGSLATSGLAGTALAQDFADRGPAPQGRRVLLKNCAAVLTMDPSVPDLENGDVLIVGSQIADIGRNIQVAEAEVIDCTGMIAMPGFINTHQHQYETQMRNIIADGNLTWAADRPQPDWPQERYGTVVQSTWTVGRIGPADDPIWDIGRSPYDPDDNYIAELVASINQINQGVTCGIDTSQSSHTPEHTDAMIEGLIASGRRAVFAYSNGRSDSPGYEFPGAINNTDAGLGRLSRGFNSGAWSRQNLVTLGHQEAPPHGWELARAFDAVIVNHNNSTGENIIDNAALLAELAREGRPVVQIHCARFTPEAYDVCAEHGVHISIADVTEMQMGHGMPPFQACLNRGILPSLSGDVETNNTPDMFSLMRAAFSLQRALIHQRAIRPEEQGDPSPMRGVGEDPDALPPLLTSYQVLQMATWAGASACGLADKVGRLRVGMDADIILLRARSLSTWPLNNAAGAIVTMMDTSHVDTVFIAGKLMKWRGQLLGVDEDKLLDEIAASRERILSRINGPAVGTNPDAIHQFSNSQEHPYRPAFLSSCCIGDADHIGVYDARPGTGARDI